MTLGCFVDTLAEVVAISIFGLVAFLAIFDLASRDLKTTMRFILWIAGFLLIVYLIALYRC